MKFKFLIILFFILSCVPQSSTLGKKKPFTSIVGFSVKGNGKWDEGESFEDVNNNGIWDNAEQYIDREEKIKPGSYLLTEINGRKFSKSSCSNKDLIINNISFFNDRNELIGFENLNAYGSIVKGEEFADTGNGKWDEGEKFTDIGNGKYDIDEEFTDTGNGKWDEGESYIDLGNGQYDQGEDFTDLNENGKWDFVLLNNLKATEEETAQALSSNYFYSELTDGNKKINIYIKTDEEIDEYQVHADCFECAISKLEESMNELEISLKSQREHEFELPETLTDPTDLSNVIILPGFEGGYNQSARRNTPRLSLITYKGEGANSKVSIDYKGHNYILKEKEALEDDGIIHKIYPDYIEYKKDDEIKILKLENK